MGGFLWEIVLHRRLRRCYRRRLAYEIKTFSFRDNLGPSSKTAGWVLVPWNFSGASLVRPCSFRISDCRVWYRTALFEESKNWRFSALRVRRVQSRDASLHALHPLISTRLIRHWTAILTMYLLDISQRVGEVKNPKDFVKSLEVIKSWNNLNYQDQIIRSIKYSMVLLQARLM
jgi:hypothetical protein